MKDINKIAKTIKYEYITNMFKNICFYGKHLDISDKNIYSVYKNNNEKEYIYIGKLEHNDRYVFAIDIFTKNKYYLITYNTKMNLNKTIEIGDSLLVSGITGVMLSSEPVKKLFYVGEL